MLARRLLLLPLTAHNPFSPQLLLLPRLLLLLLWAQPLRHLGAGTPALCNQLWVELAGLAPHTLLPPAVELQHLLAPALCCCLGRYCSVCLPPGGLLHLVLLLACVPARRV